MATNGMTDLRRRNFPADSETAMLKAFAAKIRRLSIASISRAGSGHPGSSLSIADALAVLYGKHLRLDPANPGNPESDIFVLSKGHAAPALYAALAAMKFFPESDMEKLRRIDSHLQGHPDMSMTPGIAISTGRLGAGFGAAVGMALDSRMTGSEKFVYVAIGDGEINEGLCWEALGLAGRLSLNNLVVMLDGNGLGLGSDVRKFSSWDIAGIPGRMGWNVILANGHDIGQLDEAIRIAKTSGRPTFIAMETVKGRGVSFMENSIEWHGKAPDQKQTEIALAELAPGIDDNMVNGLVGRRACGRRESKRPRFMPLKTDFEKWKRAQPTRKAFGDWLVDSMGQLHGKPCVGLVSMQADVGKSVMTTEAESRFGLVNDGSGRCVDVGIREQLMLAMMAGMASRGNFIPVGATFASFAEIGLDLARQLFARNRLPGILAGTHSGLQVAGDGASHMDMTSLMTYGSVPGIEVLEPADSYSAAKLLTYAFNSQKGSPRLVYVRLTRSDVPHLCTDSRAEFAGDVEPELGYRVALPRQRGGAARRVAIVASGAMVDTAIKAAEIVNVSGAASVVKVIDAFSPMRFGAAAQNDPRLFSGCHAVATIIDATPETLALPVMEYIFRSGGRAALMPFGASFFRARSGTMHDVYREHGLLPEQIADAIISGKRM